MSMQIFEDHHFDPLLIFENNFDGDPDAYWCEVLQQIGDDLRSIFACTKAAARQPWAALFEEGSTRSLVPFLKAHAVSPSAAHFGAVTCSLERIKRDQSVFVAVQQELDNHIQRYRGLDTAAVHRELRGWATAQFPWLSRKEQPDSAQIIAAYKRGAIQPVLPAAGVAALALGSTAFFCFSPYLPDHGHSAARSVLRSLAAIGVFGAGCLAVWFWKTLRRLEESDWSQDNPQLDAKQLQQFAGQEDQIVQNHLASMVLVKPGFLRGILIRSALRLLKFLVPLTASNGYLGSMRTIHFAHWTLVGNGARLLFFSNFDGSWQSYLDDFVDKAHGGLTLAWGNCVGFPKTKNLVQEGATHGPAFKAWARQSQTQSILWYSAYKDLTVNQIVRNAGIVDGLRKPLLTGSKAQAWADLL